MAGIFGSADPAATPSVALSSVGSAAIRGWRPVASGAIWRQCESVARREGMTFAPVIHATGYDMADVIDRSMSRVRHEARAMVPHPRSVTMTVPYPCYPDMSPMVSNPVECVTIDLQDITIHGGSGRAHPMACPTG